MPKYFCFSSEEGFAVYDTAQEAKSEAMHILECYREEAIGSEWGDGIERVTWGRIYEQASVVAEDKAASGTNVDCYVDFGLTLV